MRGDKVTLRPFTENDPELFYHWATQSDATPFWYGKLYGDIVPSKEKFFSNWKSYYFDGSKPKLGRCFLILVKDIPIGQINYNKLDQNSTELDIVIGDSKNWGKGYGSDAMKTLTNYLFDEGVREVWVFVLKRNPRAIKMYEKAGFVAKLHPRYIQIPTKGTTKKEDWIFMSTTQKE